MTGNRWYHQCFQGWEWGDLLAFKGSNHNRSNLRKTFTRIAKKRSKRLFKKEIENEQRDNFID